MKSLLPPLKDDHAVVKPASSGEWVLDDNSLLKRISDGLKTTEFDYNAEDLISIPDVWARTAVVKNALFDESHSLHKRIQSEWRGLIGLIALASYHKMSLSVDLVNIESLKSAPFKTETKVTEIDGNFGAVLNAILPNTVLAQGMNWNEIGAIKIDQRPVGLIVPSTLVCPTKFYSGIVKEIPWFDGKQLIDPSMASDIKPEEILVLKNYLTTLESSMSGATISDRYSFDGILGELKKFKDSCEKRVASYSSGLLDIQGFKRSAINLTLPSHPIYDALKLISEFDAGGQHAFETLIKPRSGLEAHVQGFILIDPDMPNIIGRSASDIRIWDTISIEKINKDKKTKNQLVKSLEVEKYILVSPEDIFTDKLCIFPSDTDSIIEHSNQIDRQYLYPLKSTVLSIFSPENIRDNCKIIDNGTSFMVSLRVNLHDHLNNKFEYTITREYLEKDVVTYLNQPEIAAVWPNFKHPKWDQYFFYYSGNLQAMVAPRLLFSIKDLEKDLSNQNTFKEVKKTLSNLDQGKSRLTKRVGIVETSIVNELHLSKNPPEALVCDCTSNTEIRTYVPNEDRSQIGLLIFPPYQEVITNNSTGKIGIDFGTTNTCVYFRKSEEPPVPIAFKNRLHSPFEIDITNERIPYILRDFIPAKNISVPYLTIAKDRQFNQSKSDLSNNLHIWHSAIYFVGDLIDSLTDIKEPVSGNLQFNLKWSQSPEDRKRIETYLGQVGVQALAEAFCNGIDSDNLEWYFSYPEAFSPDQLRSFKKLFASSVNKVLDPLGESPKNYNVNYKSESLTSALYFASHKEAAFTESVITIDIGGQTSDVSIWQSRKLLWRSSVQIAGRHILIDFLTKNIDLIKDIAIEDKMIEESFPLLQSIQKDLSTDEIRNAVEVMVNSDLFAKGMANRFHIIDGQDSGKNLKTISELSLCGILYYVGQVIENLTASKKYNPKSSKSVTICLGGKASLIYKAIFKDSDDQTGIKKLFADASNGSISPDQIQFTFSDNPKHEASHGLLVSEKGIANLDTSTQDYSLLLGEDIEMGGEQVNYDQSINTLVIEKEWRALNLNNIKKFSELLKKNAEIIFEVTRKVENTILSKINMELVESQEKLQEEKKQGLDPFDKDLKGETSLMEPCFIVALREIMQKASTNEIKITSKRH